MKIGLVSAYTHPFALGLRYLSAYLKSMGHDVVMLFMSSHRDTTQPDYSPAALADFIDRLRDRDLIGISLMTSNFHRACALTAHIRAAGLKAPIAWGGTHPTVAPAECVEHADLVCIGEGEEPLLQLVERLERGRDPTDVPSFWFRAGGPFGNATPIRNPLAPLETHLDDLPFPDYELDTHWIADRDGLVPATRRHLRGALDTLRVVTTRGCPYHCTFCNNAALRQVHAGLGRWVRTRSLANVLAELREMLACFPTIRAVNFVDDLFFVRSEEEIEAFARQYNAEIKLPLQLDAFPNTVTDRKVRALAQVPIQLISMGIESASTDTLTNIYQRPTTKARIAAAMDTFARYRVRTEYHYVVSNPFEPEANVIETMRFIADHHRGPSVLRVFPLMFYPATPLYERARRAGLIAERHDVAYDHMGTGGLDLAAHDYLAMWLRCVLNLRNVGAPRRLVHGVISFATAPPVRWALDRRWFGPTVFITYIVLRKFVRNFLYQPFVKPWTYLRRRPRHNAAGRSYRVPRENRAALRHRAPPPVTAPAAALVMPDHAAHAAPPAQPAREATMDD